MKVIKCALSHLSYHDAARIAEDLRCGQPCDMFLLDLSLTDVASTAALARLVVLRRSLRQHGRELHLLNLHGKARHIYEINHMAGLLPCEPHTDAPWVPAPPKPTRKTNWPCDRVSPQ